MDTLSHELPHHFLFHLHKNYTATETLPHTEKTNYQKYQVENKTHLHFLENYRTLFNHQLPQKVKMFPNNSSLYLGGFDCSKEEKIARNTIPEVT